LAKVIDTKATKGRNVSNSYVVYIYMYILYLAT